MREILLFRAKDAKTAKERRTGALAAHLTQRHPQHKEIPLDPPQPHNEPNTQHQMACMDEMDGMQSRLCILSIKSIATMKNPAVRLRYLPRRSS